MHAPITITPSQLPELLLGVAVVRPVMIWGPPGCGKSTIVESFASSLGLRCVSLLGTQLAPEDLMGVPQITAEGRSRFCPPEMIARDEPYCLFLDELNGASHDVQKAFYSLILEHRVGDYTLPEGSVVIGAGNRAHDNAIVRPMSSALVNRLVHIHLVSSPRDWLAWASSADIHPLVYDYIRQRPDHLSSPAPKHEEPFSSPRAWHMVSDVLHSLGEGAVNGDGTVRRANDEAVAVAAYGCVSPAHAGQFLGYRKQLRHAWDLDAILRGERHWPREVADRDVLYFLAQSLRARLTKELPASKAGGSETSRQLAHRAKGLLVDLAAISLEVAQLVVAPAGNDADGSDGAGLPAWFMIEVVRELPRLAAERA